MTGQRRCRFERCGREFWPHRADQQFCSAWCRRDAWRLAHAPAVEPLGRFDHTTGGDPDGTRDEASGTPFTGP